MAGMLALVLAFTMTVAGCDNGTEKGDEKKGGGGGNSITVTGITGKTGDASIYVVSSFDNDNGMAAAGAGKISGGSVTFSLVKDEAMTPWTGSGSYYLMLGFDQDDSEYYYTNGQTISISAEDENFYAKLPKYTITSAASTIAFNLFKEITLSNDNRPDLTGTVAINNTSPKVGDTLTAAYSGGNGTGTATWQWIQGESTNIGTNSNTYTVAAADEGKTIKVQVSFANQKNSKTSAATGLVTVNNRPGLTGTVAIDNTSPKVGDTLTAAYSGGNGTGTATWQWVRGESANIGTNSSTYTVVEDDWGQTIKVQVSFADQINNVTSTATAAAAGGQLSLTKWTQILQAIQNDTSFNGTLDLSGYTGTTTSAGVLNSSGSFDPSSGGSTGKGKIKNITLPGSAVSIASNAFSSSSGFSVLESVTGANITSIGTAFSPASTTLKSVVFPKVTGIPNDAFNGCTGLETAQFAAATAIGNNAFKGCTKLKTIDFPEAASIGTNAFENCAGLITVNFPKVTSLGGSAFLNCANLDRASFPTATTVGSSAFEDCAKLARVDIPSVTMIGANAFDGAGRQFRPTMIFSSTTPGFEVRLGKTPPQLGTYLFGNTSSLGATYVKVYIPSTGANETVYLASPTSDGSISDNDSSNVWVNGFRGAGWNASGSVITAGFRNSNITIGMRYDS